MNTTIKPKTSKFQIVLFVLLIANLLMTGWLAVNYFETTSHHLKVHDVTFRTFDVYENEFDYIEKQLKKLDTDIKYQSMQKK